MQPHFSFTRISVQHERARMEQDVDIQPGNADSPHKNASVTAMHSESLAHTHTRSEPPWPPAYVIMIALGRPSIMIYRQVRLPIHACTAIPPLRLKCRCIESNDLSCADLALCRQGCLAKPQPRTSLIIRGFIFQEVGLTRLWAYHIHTRCPYSAPTHQARQRRSWQA